jgi:hypothetical protein
MAWYDLSARLERLHRCVERCVERCIERCVRHWLQHRGWVQACCGGYRLVQRRRKATLQPRSRLRSTAPRGAQGPARLRALRASGPCAPRASRAAPAPLLVLSWSSPGQCTRGPLPRRHAVQEHASTSDSYSTAPEQASTLAPALWVLRARRWRSKRGAFKCK